MATTPFPTTGTEIRRDWDLAVTVDMVLQRQGANPGKIRRRQPRLVAVAERAIAEGKLRIQPQVAFRVLKILGVNANRVTLKADAELVGPGIARSSRGRSLQFQWWQRSELVLRRWQSDTRRKTRCSRSALDGYGTAVVGALTVAIRSFFCRVRGHCGVDNHVSALSRNE